MAEPDNPAPQPPERNPGAPETAQPEPNADFTGEKMPGHRIMAQAVQQVAATAAELESRRGPSMWLYVIAVILALFLLAMVLLTAVASKP